MTDYSQALDEISNSGAFTVFGVYFAVFIMLIILIIVFRKKSRSRSRELTRKEIQGYFDGFREMNEQSYRPAGNVTLNGGVMVYSRGSSSIVIDLYIDKDETILFPALAEKWFDNHNYTLKQETAILEDIKKFILDNKLSKRVVVMTDEEAEEYFTENNF